MRTALISALAGIGIGVGLAGAAAAATEENPRISTMPRDGYYHSEEGYLAAQPWEVESRVVVVPERRVRAFLPDLKVETRPRTDDTGIRRFKDESLTAPIFAQ